jgi:hypothetical protein
MITAYPAQNFFSHTPQEIIRPIKNQIPPLTTIYIDPGLALYSSRIDQNMIP